MASSDEPRVTEEDAGAKEQRCRVGLPIVEGRKKRWDVANDTLPYGLEDEKLRIGDLNV